MGAPAQSDDYVQDASVSLFNRQAEVTGDSRLGTTKTEMQGDIHASVLNILHDISPSQASALNASP